MSEATVGASDAAQDNVAGCALKKCRHVAQRVTYILVDRLFQDGKGETTRIGRIEQAIALPRRTLSAIPRSSG